MSTDIIPLEWSKVYQMEASIFADVAQEQNQKLGPTLAVPASDMLADYAGCHIIAALRFQEVHCPLPRARLKEDS